MDLSKRVGMNIRAIRKAQNLTIDELAEKCEFQAPNLSDVERGERNITLQTLNKILYALEVDPGSVLIPESRTNKNPESIKEELLKILFNTLEDKNEDDIRMLLNITNEIFGRFKHN
ncbi:helix-turn-helix domain-containing protein [Lysinibacillus xylanilyticus]|uniref:Helix-turn-helix domain-containing protein n=1 Tax=Lysinibacillus xylanilyticus TaxID=582475 RepID=A0ABT4EWK8_9BACI|nr:helix-turn-helix transcriptional regulator [Lysinibacillus xylanilyticus]MCY9550063.1 helix-turn-helix domain-containing protein [Lysinibacillus xylanilyticus]